MLLKIICLCLLSLSLALESEEENVPNPLTLSPNFFSYYQTDETSVLEARIQKTIESLNVAFLNISESAQDQLLMYINKITIHLEMLAQLKAEKVAPSKVRLFKKNYTFDDIEKLLNAEELAHVNEQKFEKERYSLASLGKKIERHIDTSMASYKSLSDNTEEKLSFGLQIFSYAASLAVMKERERIISEKLERLAKEKEDFQQEEEYAFQHLDMEPTLSKNLKKNLDEQNGILSMRELASLHAELTASSVFGDSEEKMSENFLIQQKSIRADIELALVNATIFELKAKILMIEEIKDNIPIEAEEVSRWIREVAEMINQKELWNSKTELELDRIGHLGFLLDDPKIKTSANPLAQLALQRYHEVQESLNSLSILDKKLLFVAALNEFIDHNLEKKQSTLALVADGTKRAFDDCCDTVGGWLHYSLFKVAGVPITLISLFEAFFILTGTYLISWLLRFLITRFIKDKSSLSHSNLFILDRLLHYVILAIGAVVALMSVGLEPVSVFWVLGALSVGIGFGLQTIVNNFASSLILLFSRSIKVQDYIQLTSGDWGQVMDISIQNTIVRTSDGIEIVIPNSELISTKFMNWTMHDPYKRFHIPFSVAYGSDKDFVEKVVKEAALNVSATIDNHPHLEGPRVWIKTLAESSLDFELVVWANLFTAKGAHGSLQSSYLWEIETALSQNHIPIPFPQCDITIRSATEAASEKLSQKNVMTPILP